MSRADGVLRVVLTGRWFDMIDRGEKLEEYREGSAYWAERLVAGMYTDGQMYFYPYHTLVASRGYTKRTLTRKIKRIRWGTPRPEWSGDTVTGECFVIELEAHTAQGEHPAERVEEKR